MKNREIINYLLIVFTFIYISISVFASSECIEPTSGLKIFEDVSFCEGVYDLDEGITVTGDNINIDCNGAILIGTLEGSAFVVTKSSRVFISNCRLEKFQYGIDIKGSSEIKVNDNIFSTNDVGISIIDTTNVKMIGNDFIGNWATGITILDSYENKIYSNHFNGESSYAINLESSKNNIIYDNNISAKVLAFNIDDKSYGNLIYGNDIYDNGFHIDFHSDDNNSYCKDGIKNNYFGDAMGPDCIIGKNNNVEDISNESDLDGNISDKVNDDDNITPDDLNLIKPLDEILLKSTTKNQASTVLSRVLVSQGIRGKKLANELEKKMGDFSKTNQSLNIKKRLLINHNDKKTVIKTIIISQNKFRDLYIYEDIPKCIVDQAKNIKYLNLNPFEIIEEDPLIVWYFPEVEEGEILDLSYEVDGVAGSKPSTIALVNDTEIIHLDGSGCGEGIIPVTVPVGEIRKESALKLFLIPFVLIPLISILYILMKNKKRNY